jgi:hypothetical protein
MLLSETHQRVFFLDIETVPAHPSFEQLDEEWQALWLAKAAYDPAVKSGAIPLSEAYCRAGIYAEFGKIICIGMGYLCEENKQVHARLKTLASQDEKQLLSDFSDLLAQLSPATRLCAHNGKEFDFPYLCRRMILQGLPLPPLLDMRGKKPWENPHLDTLELWKFGDSKNFASLKLMAKMFGLPSPKNSMDGSEVFSTYYRDKDLNRIAAYCSGDVLTLMNVYLRLHLLPALQPQQVVSAE